MKKTLILGVAVILAAGLLLTGCGNGDDDEKDTSKLVPHPGSNLVTEQAILAATGVGGTSVTKISGGYQVTGKVTEWANWDGSITDNRITLVIKADTLFGDAYFKNATRYILEANFPNSAVKPIPEYTEGFRIYLENISATDNTDLWSGTWGREWPDEYNAIGGVGVLAIDRDLRLDPATVGSVSNVGDYQQLVIILGFEDEDVGKEYTFTISKAEVWADAVVIPGLAAMSNFFSGDPADLQSYPTGMTYSDGKIQVKTVAAWNGPIVSQMYFSNTGKTYSGGYYVSINIPSDTALNVISVNTFASNDPIGHVVPDGWVSDKSVTGSRLTGNIATYWDGNLWSGEPSTTELSIVCIVITFEDGTEVGADFEFTINEMLVANLE